MKYYIVLIILVITLLFLFFFNYNETDFIINNEPGTAFFVSNEGDDNNDGLSIYTSWKSLSKVNEALSDGTINIGDDIYFKRGDIWKDEGSINVRIGGTFDNYMNFGSYGTGSNPIFIGDSGYGFDRSNEGGLDYLIIQDFNIFNYDGAIRLGLVEGVHDSNNWAIRNIKSDGRIKIMQVDGYLIENCKVQGINILGTGGSWGNSSIRNGIISNCTFGEPWISGNPSGDGLQIHHGGSGDPSEGVCGPNHYVFNCSSGYHSEQGFDITSGMNIYCKNSKSYNNTGIVIGHLAENVFIDNLYVYDCNGTGILIKQGKNRIIRNSIINSFENQGFGIWGEEGLISKNNCVYNNLLVSYGQSELVSTKVYTESSFFKNNIFYSTDLPGMRLFIDYDQSADIELAEQLFSHNIYWYNGRIFGENKFWQKNDSKYSLNISEWNDLNRVINDSYINPELKNIRNEDFTLSVNSPCIDAGDWLTYTMESGFGRNIPVENACYFFGGLYNIGINDVNIEGDSIFIGDNKNLKIVDIDYEKNMLTVNQNITWNKGDIVSLNSYCGLGPDIGPNEYCVQNN